MAEPAAHRDDTIRYGSIHTFMWPWLLRWLLAPVQCKHFSLPWLHFPVIDSFTAALQRSQAVLQPCGLNSSKAPPSAPPLKNVSNYVLYGYIVGT